MRKIAFIHNSFPAGGAERITIDIANYVRDYGYETVVLAHKAKEDFGVEYPPLVEFPNDEPMHAESNTRFIIDYINSNGVDLLVIPGLSIPGIGQIRKNVSCKIVFALHCAPFWEGVSKLYVKKMKALKSSKSMLKWYLSTYPREKLLHKYEKSTYKHYLNVYNNCDAYVFLCDAYKQRFVEKLRLADEAKLHVIHNSEHIPQMLNFDKRKEIIFVGRLTYEDKRVDRLLRIWKIASSQLPDWKLRIIGTGPERERLEAMSRRMELERVTFEGFHRDVKPFYDTASIICLTSTFEGWGLCLTEAQANGVVPIAFGCSAGVREIIKPDWVNGVVVPPFSIKRFASDLVSLASDGERLGRMQRSVAERVKEFSPEETGRKWVELFDRLLG